NHSDVHLHGVAGTEVRNVGTQRLGVQGVERVHRGLYFLIRWRGNGARGPLCGQVQEGGPVRERRPARLGTTATVLLCHRLPRSEKPGSVATRSRGAPPRGIGRRVFAGVQGRVFGGVQGRTVGGIQGGRGEDGQQVGAALGGTAQGLVPAPAGDL